MLILESRLPSFVVSFIRMFSCDCRTSTEEHTYQTHSYFFTENTGCYF